MFKTALNIGISVIEIYLPCETLHSRSNEVAVSQGKYFGACPIGMPVAQFVIL